MLEKIAAIFSIGWKKWHKQIPAVLLTAAITLAGLFFIPTTPALAAEPTTPPITSEQSTPPENNTGENATQQTPSEETAEPPSSETNCNDQLGAIGWIICPSTGAIAKAIDYIYGIIVDLIKIDPITTDQSSATYIIWEYAKSITNVVFIIFIVIIIISQVTGFGISNYGLKKALPRIVVAAVLVNLSFIICTLAVDVSNILGFSVHNLFASVAENLATSGVSLDGIPTISWADFTTGILSGVPLAGAAGVAGMAFAGGLGGLIWLVAPVVLGALVAIIAALLTLAARQALVTLLVMVAPLAIVAYLLPNTEPLFKKWRDLLTKLLVFFPMFSLLFGASQLAGWAIMLGSNSNTTIFILGMAVQIFPLIFTPTLLKMSGTVLGKVNELARRPFAPMQNALKNRAIEGRANQRARYLARSNSAGAALANSLAAAKERRKLLREANEGAGAAYAKRTAYSQIQKNQFGRLHQLENAEESSRLGNAKAEEVTNDVVAAVNTKIANTEHLAERLKKASNAKLRASGTQQTLDNNLSEYTKSFNGATAKALEKDSGDAFKLSHIQSRRKANIDASDTAWIAEQIRQAEKDHKEGIANTLYAQISNADGGRGAEGINSIIANAIASADRIDKAIQEDYFTYHNAQRYTDDIRAALRSSFVTRNKNEMAATAKVMLMRGDTDQVAEEMERGTKLNMGDSDEEYAMQKMWSDTFIPYKKDAVHLWGFSKASNIMRAKANLARTKQAEGKTLSEKEQYALDHENFTFDEYMDTSKDSMMSKMGLNIEKILSGVSDLDIFETQDRTVQKYLKSRNVYGFTEKQARGSMLSGRMEGERLSASIDWITGGKYEDGKVTYSDLTSENDDGTTTVIATATELRAQGKERIYAQIKDSAARQISQIKTDELTAYSDVLGDGDQASGLQAFCNIILTERPKTVEDLRKLAARGQLDGMNPNIRTKLNAILKFEKNSPPTPPAPSS